MSRKQDREKRRRAVWAQRMVHYREIMSKRYPKVPTVIVRFLANRKVRWLEKCHGRDDASEDPQL